MVTVLPTAPGRHATPIHVVSAQLAGDPAPEGSALRQHQVRWLCRASAGFAAGSPGPLLFGLSTSSTPRTAVYRLLRVGREPVGPDPPAAVARPAAVPVGCSSVRVSWPPLDHHAEGDAPVLRYELHAAVVSPSHPAAARAGADAGTGAAGRSGNHPASTGGPSKHHREAVVADSFEPSASAPDAGPGSVASAWSVPGAPSGSGSGDQPPGPSAPRSTGPVAGRAGGAGGGGGPAVVRVDGSVTALVGRVSQAGRAGPGVAGAAGPDASIEALPSVGSSFDNVAHTCSAAPWGATAAPLPASGEANHSRPARGAEHDGPLAASAGGAQAFLRVAVVSASELDCADPAGRAGRAAGCHSPPGADGEGVAGPASAAARLAAWLAAPSGPAAAAGAGAPRAIAGRAGALAPPSGHARRGAGLDGLVTTVVTGLSSGAVYVFRVTAVSAVGPGRVSPPSLAVITPSTRAQSASQTRLAAELADRGVTSAELTPAELREMGCVGAAAELQSRQRVAGGSGRRRASRPRGSGGDAGSRRGEQGGDQGRGWTMARPRAAHWLPGGGGGDGAGAGAVARPPGGAALWGAGPLARQEEQEAAAAAAAAAEAARAARAAARRDELEAATNRAGMSDARSAAVAAFADSGARAAAASADSSAEGKSDDEAGDAGAVSSDEDIDALSVCAAAPTARSEGPSGRGRDEPVADDPDPAAAMDAEHAARLTGAASLLRPAGPEQLLWAADGFVMGADGGSTEVELRQKERRRVAVQSAARPQPRWQAATLQDDLQSLGVTEATAGAAALAALEPRPGPRRGGRHPPSSGAADAEAAATTETTAAATPISAAAGGATGARGTAATASCAAVPLRAARPLPVPEEWRAPSAPGSSVASALLARRAPGDDALVAPARPEHTMLEDWPTEATPRDEAGAALEQPGTASAHVPWRGLAPGAGGGDGRLAGGGERAASYFLARGIDPRAEMQARPDPSWTGRRGRRVHQLGLASAYECYRYLLPEEDPDALPEPRGGGDGRAPGADVAALPGATQRHHRGESGGRVLEAAGGDRDGDAASAADSFEYHPPSTHRAVVADSDSDGADFGSDVGEDDGADFGSDVGEDDGADFGEGVGEDVGSTGRRRARSSAQPGIGRSTSSGTCASSGALSDAWDGDASSTGSPRPEEEESDDLPPARGRRRSRSRHQPCQIPTRAAGLGPGIKQAPRLGPAELRGLAPAEARLSALLHRSSRWEPPLGRAEPGMTVLSPVGTPGGDGLDDTPCHPGERFRRTRAARQCLEGADSPTAPPAPDADARSDVSADSEGAWSSGDGPVTVACVDYIFYTAQLLELAAVGRIPTALLPDEVPDATNTLEAADDEILPNSARASNHLGLLARFRIKSGSLPAAAQAGYQH